MAELSHQLARSLILAADEAGLPAPDNTALTAHLAGCGECRAYSRSLEITRQKVKRSLDRRWNPARVRVSMDKIQSGSRRNNMSKRMMLTGGTLAVIAVLALVVVRLSNTLPLQANTAIGPVTLTPTTAPSATDLPTAALQPPVDYTVRSGDVCSSLALAFNVSVQSLIVANNLSASCTLNVGDHLKIPYPTATPARATPPGTNATPVRLGKGAILPYVRWSPDGQRLIIHSADDLLFYTVNRDGSGLSKLSNLQAWDARWSADGRTIRICQEQTGQPAFKIFSVSPDGSNLTGLPAEEAVAPVLDGHCPSVWSPDGKTIAFAKSDGLGLYFVDANGENIRQVVAPDLAAVNVLKWSMDASGSTLIFSALDPAKTVAPTGIYTTQIDNAGHIVSRNLLHLMTDLESFVWKVSPDEQKIIYVPEQPTGIYTADVVSSGAWTKLTDLQPSNWGDENLQWSPDGSQIAFSSYVNRDPDIFVIDADGTNLRYYPNPGSSEQPVGWSPDGKSLVFSSQLQDQYQTPAGPITLNLIDVKDLAAYDNAPTPTAPPPYPAPELLQPADGASLPASSDTVTLIWAPVAGLRADETYVVTVVDLTDGQGSSSTAYVIDPLFSVSEELRPTDGMPHLFRWEVTTARQAPLDSEGRPSWLPVGLTSVQRVFSWQGPALQVSATPNALTTITGAGQCQSQGESILYVVKPGDFVANLAMQFDVSAASIIMANNLGADAKIVVGQQLRIPLPTPQASANTEKVAYTVQAGDTFASIAANYGVPVQSIRDLNGLSADAALRVGDSLWIPLSSRTDATPTVQPPLDYTVRQGDVLSSIAFAFNVSVQSIILQNNLSADSVVTAGQILKIPHPTPTPQLETTTHIRSLDWPLPEHYLSGKDYSATHRGLDLAGKAGENVQSSGAGTVIFAGVADGGLGNTIVIDHGNAYTSVYAHLAELRVACGADVALGQVIGTVGQSGDATGPVLYFEIRYQDIPQNPWNFLPPP